MILRTLFSLVNLAVASGTLFVWFVLPQFATFALYGFLAWVGIGLSLIWATRGSRPVSTTSPLPAGGAPAALGTSRGSSTLGGTPVPEIGFCIYCATDLVPGEGRCRVCGHAVHRSG